MPYASNDNAVLYSGCNNLQNLTVLVEFSTAISTVNNSGWTLQLNCYPPTGHFCQMVEVNWFQYVIYVWAGVLSYEIQYWSLGSSAWPPGVTPVGGTHPWLPCWADDDRLHPFATGLTGDTMPSGSFLQFELATDPDDGVTAATFTYVDPNGIPQTAVVPVPIAHPFNGFQLNFGGIATPPMNGVAVLTPSVPVGLIRYSVSSGQLAVLSGDTESSCVGVSMTGETSNMAYSDVKGAPGSTVTQTLEQPIPWVGPTKLTFSPQPVGTTSSQQTVYVAIGADVTLTSISLVGDVEHFNCVPPPGDSNLNVQNGVLVIGVWFRPLAVGPFTALLQIAHNAAGSPLSVELDGKGDADPVPQLTVSPQSVLFTTKKKTNHTVSLTNSGTAPLTIKSIAFDRPSSFTFGSTCNVGPSGGVLNPGPALHDHRGLPRDCLCHGQSAHNPRCSEFS